MLPDAISASRASPVTGCSIGPFEPTAQRSAVPTTDVEARTLIDSCPVVQKLQEFLSSLCCSFYTRNKKMSER